MPPIPDRLLPGRGDTLGANWDGLGVNFAVFSAHADRIELCLFDPSGRREVARPRCRNPSSRTTASIGATTAR